MAVPVSKSNLPLVADTLPAVTVRHACGGKREILYTQGRFYALGNALSLGLTCFVRTPPPECAVSFAIGGEGAHYLSVQLRPEPMGAAVYLCKKRDFGGPLPSAAPSVAQPAPAYYAGADEQGWYWGATLLLDQALLQQSGVCLAEGAWFNAALFQHTLGQTGFAVSAVQANGTLPSFEALPKFVVVGY